MKPSNLRQLKDKCIWLTGASSGIGRELARQLCEQGNFVIASGRNVSNLNELVLWARGRANSLPFDMDLPDAQLQELQQRLTNITDYLDMVICCAGVCEYEDNLDFDPAMYRRVFEVNFLGVIKTLHIAMPLLNRCEHNPRIVLVGSLAGVLPFPRAEAYGASKAALNYFADALRLDAQGSRLGVTLVNPGFVRSPLTDKNDFPMPFLMGADQAARIIIRGIEKGKKNILFPRRLSWPLLSLSVFKSIWLGLIAPHLRRDRVAFLKD